MTTLQEALLTAALDASSQGLISGTTNWAAFVAKSISAAPAPQAQPVAPHECKTEAEKIAYAAGWWKALESVHMGAQPVAAKEPVKLYAGPPDAPPTEKRFFDANGTEYTLMSGCISNCIFAGFEKLVAAGLQMEINDEPKNADGIIRARVEVVDIEPVAQPHKLSDGDLIDAVANSIKAANNTA